MRSRLLAAAVAIAAVLLAREATRGAAAPPAPRAAAAALLPQRMPDPCPLAKPVPDALTLPATVPPGDPVAIEQKMLAYLQHFEYRMLNWCVDKAIRDTGPYVHGQYFGTHPAVRIYYSPQMIRWLRGGRKGVPEDGAVAIKEQYSPTPAARYAGLRDDQLHPDDWTIMIRRSSASRDGWFWAEVYTGMFAPPQPAVKTAYQNAGFGLYCLRCHASAAHAMTFASTANIKGFPGEPLTYYVDNTWRTPAPNALASATPQPTPLAEGEHEKNKDPALREPALAAHAPLPMQTFPAEPLDTFVAAHGGAHQFLTSDQCMGCHSAAAGPVAGPMMWLTPPPNATPTPTPASNAGAIGVNVSEYGEWRWSPMGLAGRDPVFYSQLESELAYIDGIPADRIAGGPAHAHATRATLKAQIVDTCMQCHGVMGKRQFALDHPAPSHATFSPEFVFHADPKDPNFHYGGLARDGVSCTVCHHAVETPAQQKSLALVLEKTPNGLFDVGPAKELYGPFDTHTIASHPMKESLDVTPVHSSLTTSSRLCTSCHSINLPVVDKTAKIHPINAFTPHDIEQITYVEWVNSDFQTEHKPNPATKRSCQDCHMPTSVVNDRLGVSDPRIQTKIAIAQDQDYPAAEHLAPLDDITVRWRDQGFRRHELLGLNAFLLRTFQQNPDALGVRLADYMSGSKNDLVDAIGNVVRQAEHKTATVALDATVHDGTLIANVGVTNLTGHRFPSGVGFRRAFVELTVTAPDGSVVFTSGRTDGDGVLVGADGRQLPTEFFRRGPDGQQRYQPHFDQEHPIERADQVQVFEELCKDADGDFTESFIRRDQHVKDNRLLPAGWRYDGQPGIVLPANWLAATHPEGVRGDPNYGKQLGGRGRAIVTYRIPLRTAVDPSTLRVHATLWYQSWSPYFRKERTTGGVAAERLRVLLGNLQLENTALANWKLRIATASATPKS